MTGSIPPSGPLSYEGQVSVPYIVRRFNPDPAYNKFPLPTVWVNPEEKTAFISVSKDLGTTEWLEVGGITNNQYPITPYVVGEVSEAGYQTIQSAINDANAGGGGTVFIQPGTYTENLTLYDKVNLLAFPGELGAIGLTTSSASVPSVVIVGNTVIDTSALLSNSNNTFSNIIFSPLTGDAISFISNQNYESVISFDGCTINVTESGKAAFSCDGFPKINLLNCSVTETTLGASNLLSVPGTYPFTIIKAKNTAFSINSTVPCVLQDGSDVHFYLSGCVYSSMIDISSSAGSYFSIDSTNTVFTWNGASNAPLVNIGPESGSITVENGSYLTGSGAFLTASTPASNTYSVITNSKFVDTINLYGDAIDQYSGCTFTTGSSPAILMNSTGDVSLNSCTVNSSANPSIGGSGSGTLTLGGITFVSNAIIAGTLTVTGSTAFLPAQFGTVGQVLTSNGPGVVPSFQASGAGSDLHIAKFIVSPGGSASGANYTTIASAIAAASSGDSIYISDGVYTENLTMKNGVNLVSLSSTSSFSSNQANNVIIIGKMIDNGSAVICNCTGINFQTNGDYIANMTGASSFNYFSCSFNATNHTIFTCSNATGRFNVDTCDGNLATTGIAFYAMTNGTIYFHGCNLANSGNSITPSTISAGTAYFSFTQTNGAIQSSGTAGTTALYSQFYTGALNITAVTFNGTQADATAIGHSFISSGTATAISVGAGVTCDVYSTTIKSTNASAIAGAGTIKYGAVTFNDTSSTISTTTKQPFNYLVPAGGVASYVLTNTGPTTPPTWQPGGGAGSDLHTCKFIVSPGGSADGANYSTIASAIAAASSGDTILIQPGTYTENLTVDKNLTFFAYSASFRHQTQNCSIVGTISLISGSVSSFFGLTLITNGGNSVSLTGNSTKGIFQNCYFKVLNANGISCAGDSDSNLYLENCSGAITGPYTLFTTTNCLVWIKNSFFTDITGTPSPSTSSSSQINLINSAFSIPFSTTSVGIIEAFFCLFGTSLTPYENVTWITTSGSTGAYVYNCKLYSGTASCISVGSSTFVNAANNVLYSSNTNVFTGAGTITTGGNVCMNSSGNNVSTINTLTTI